MKRYHQLYRLVRLLYESQLQAGVKNPYKEELSKRLNHPRYESLLDLLICQITLLHRHSRLKENGLYKSEQSDFVAALNLLKSELIGRTVLNPCKQIAYDKLLGALGKGRLFKRKDVERITGYSKTRSFALLQELLHSERIERAGGTANRGYYYRFKVD